MRSLLTRGALVRCALFVALVLAGQGLHAQILRTADATRRGLRETDFPRLVKLADEVYAYEDLNGDLKGNLAFTTNSLIVITTDGVVVVDGQGSVAKTKRLVERIKTLTPQPIKYMIVGADHGDHVAGNSAFPAGTTFISHPTSKSVIEAMAAGLPVVVSNWNGYRAAVKDGENGVMIARHARKNVDQVAGYHHSAGAYDYSGLGWTALVRIPVEEAYASIDSLTFKMVVVLLVTAAVTLVLGALIGVGTARPIIRLTGTMQELAHGNNAVDIPSAGLRSTLLVDEVTFLRDADGTTTRQAVRSLLATSGSRSVSAMASEIFAAMSGGVFGGATTANQAIARNPGNISAIEGTSGNSATRVSLPTPSAFSLPSRTRGNTLPRLSTSMST